jgi:uncharacterized protein YgiM (DUF1202 family)
MIPVLSPDPVDHPLHSIRKKLPLIRLTFLVVLLCVITLSTTPIPARSQDNSTPPVAVYVEAINQANLRSGPGIDYDIIGEITAGQKYPMVARSAQFPWYLIQLPNGIAWVYVDLVKVTGPFNTIPFSEIIITPGVPVLPPTETPDMIIDASGTPVVLPSETPIITSGVTVEAMSVANVRYGPGTDFRRIGQIQAGTRYEVLRRHTQFEWVEIAFKDSPSGRGWVSLQTVTLTGNLYDLPAISDSDFGYPTLTPTAIMVVTAAPPNSATPPVSNDPKLVFLGNTVYDMLLQSRFDPGTERQASVFIQDLTTKQTVSLNPGVAYSGVSMMKIPVMLAYYRKYTTPVPADRAPFVSNMMVCSINNASNHVLRYIGDGDIMRGAQYVTETMQMMGLKDTFITRPFSEGKAVGTPTPTPRAEEALQTTIDQNSAVPDKYNQTTPADLGWLLSDIYQCAIDSSGPIVETFKGDVTMTECRQIINTMRYNKIGSLIEAGLPDIAGVTIAHKHGWGDDTHGDAAIVTSPGGDFILVAILHNKDWLKSEESFPLVAEISRLTFNTLNPSTPLDKINLQPVPAECSYPQELINILALPDLPAIR